MPQFKIVCESPDEKPKVEREIRLVQGSYGVSMEVRSVTPSEKSPWTEIARLKKTGYLYLPPIREFADKLDLGVKVAANNRIFTTHSIIGTP